MLSMNHNEIEESGKDFEIEITDLDEIDASGGSPRPPRLFMEPRFISRKYRKPVTITTTAFIVLAMLLLLLSTSPLKLFFTQRLPSTGPATFSLRLDANPPWGHLYVDDQSVTLSKDAYPQFSVARGRHRLTWQAAPFSPQQCVISLPVGSGTDTCRHPDAGPNGQDDVRKAIFFSANLSMLSPEQRSALIMATQRALASQQSGETIQAGELYALNAETPGSSHRSCTLLQIAVFCFAAANQPLQAKLSMQLATDTSRNNACLPETGACMENGQNCRLFCDGSAFRYLMRVSDRTVWQSFVTVHVFWQFSTMKGQVIVANQSDTFILGMQNEHSMQLNIRWSGKGWDVTPVRQSDSSTNNDPVCEAAYGDLYTLGFAATPPSGLQLVQETTTASGCLIRISLQADPNASPTPTSAPPTVVYVLQRFGVLLAVNTSAHRLWPFLPVTKLSQMKAT
jgi:hypothetical protein